MQQRPRKRYGHAVDAIVVVLAALSDLLVALWLPLAVLRVLRRQSRSDLAAPVALLVGIAIQGLAIVTQHSPKTYTSVELHQLPIAYALRVGGSFFIGDRFIVRAHHHLGGALTALMVTALALLAIVTLWLVERRARLWVAAALVGSVVWFLIPVLLRGTTFLVTLRSLNGSRYSVIPVLALALALLIAVTRPRHCSVQARQVGAGVVSLFLVVMMIINYRVGSSRSAGPGWRTSVQSSGPAVPRPDA
jgi:hypothetical protein